MSAKLGGDASQSAANIDGPSRQPRITPRNSDGDEALQAAAAKETPWRTLNQLANIPRPTTPLRRASSAGPSSTRRSARRTPGTGHRANGSGKKVAVTPHGRAAKRELDLRRAGFTPGRDRRRSGRQQRETPRDILRALSRHLAPKTLPTVPTPEGRPASAAKSRFRVTDDDDLDDEPELKRPRFSLPLEDDEDEDDSLLLPPRSAGLEDENFTVQSVELGRRAISEQPYGRLSRGSFGSIRMSDVFADLNDMARGGDMYDSSVVGDNFGDDVGNGLDDEAFPEENTATLRNLGLFASGRDSDIRPANLPADDTGNTFVFTVPHREPTEEPAPENTTQSLIESIIFDQGPDEEPVFNEEEQDEQDEEDEEQDEQDEQVDAENMPPASSPRGLDGDVSMLDTTMQESEVAEMTRVKNARKKKVKVSRHGIQYPSLPAGVVKKLATSFARTAGSKAKINKEALDAIMQASDWFFEQVSDDLGAYAKHAGRKTIDESDIVTLMARQRQTNASTTPFSLAQKYLPRELLQELRMVPPTKFKKSRALERIEEDEED